MGELNSVLPALFSELVNGSPDPQIGTVMLNRGDRGLLHSLEQISGNQLPVLMLVEHTRPGRIFGPFLPFVELAFGVVGPSRGNHELVRPPLLVLGKRDVAVNGADAYTLV